MASTEFWRVDINTRMNDYDNDIKNLYSNHALHEAHRDWVPDYKNPYNLILTFSDDVSEKHARKKYSEFIRKLSKRIYKKRLPQTW